MSLPRNFKLKNSNVEGIDACDNLCSISVHVVGLHLLYVVVWHDFVEKYKLFINASNFRVSSFNLTIILN